VREVVPASHIHREEGIYLSPFLTVLQPGTTQRSSWYGKEGSASGHCRYVGHADDRSAFRVDLDYLVLNLRILFTAHGEFGLWPHRLRGRGALSAGGRSALPRHCSQWRGRAARFRPKGRQARLRAGRLGRPCGAIRLLSANWRERKKVSIDNESNQVT
jgi:hypothetical protein